MIVVFSKANCPACVQAKQLLRQKSIDFKEVVITEQTRADFIAKYPTVRLMPYIELEGLDGASNPIGGINDLRAFLTTLENPQ